ncbi:MAG: radical SAM protein [Myxococcales bacterium]|nr:radical SAM protein [Myxococcales bacterium]
MSADIRRAVLAGIAAGRPHIGPQTVHVDVTNTCNAACITCWDHSPLLDNARSAAWKRRRLPRERFEALVDELSAMGSVQEMILSGMGDPLTHPDIYEMIAAVKQRGFRLTMLTNLVAADIDKLCDSGVDQLLVGVHGVTPESYCAFHPGWTEQHFFRMCRYLRALRTAGVSCRHVQVINRDTADELCEMVRFGDLFAADRVNFKLASLAEGTERCAITDAQRRRLREHDIDLARALADDLGVRTNLALFERQVAAADALGAAPQTTTPMHEIGCYMGYVYTRITVDLEVLYCCNTEVKVGRLDEGERGTGFAALWQGERWQALRAAMARHEYLPGCERCGKLEQNVKWSARVREAAAKAAATDSSEATRA